MTYARCKLQLFGGLAEPDLLLCEIGLHENGAAYKARYAANVAQGIPTQRPPLARRGGAYMQPYCPADPHATPQPRPGFRSGRKRFQRTYKRQKIFR